LFAPGTNKRKRASQVRAILPRSKASSFAKDQGSPDRAAWANKPTRPYRLRRPIST